MYISRTFRRSSLEKIQTKLCKYENHENWEKQVNFGMQTAHDRLVELLGTLRKKQIACIRWEAFCIHWRVVALSWIPLYNPLRPEKWLCTVNKLSAEIHDGSFRVADSGSISSFTDVSRSSFYEGEATC